MTSLEAALAVLEDKPLDDERTQLAKAKARAQITGYDARWDGEPYSALAVEDEFSLPILNPDTQRNSQVFQQVGKIDVRLIDACGKKYNMDHKTTSMDISDPASTFWHQLAIESQVSMYALASWQQGTKIDGSIWDVIKKPTIRQKKIPKELKNFPNREGTRGEIDNCGTYYSFEVTQNDRQWLEYNDSETPHLYECRLTRDCLDRPEHYYQRRTVPRLDSEMLEWAEELWTIARDVRDTQLKADKLERPEVAWFRNSGACMNYGTPCEYLGLCAGYETADGGLWHVREKPHAELSVESEADRWDMLSHSSIQCYQTCRRKAYWKYERRLEKIDEEEKDALFYGSLIHDALEAWWTHQ